MRRRFPDVDLREWEPDSSPLQPSANPAGRLPGAGVPELALPAEARDSAEGLLRRLLGVPLRTVAGRRNLILQVSPPDVVVGTSRSPQGQIVPIADLEQALTLLRRDGSVTITPEILGHRSSFIGAVLLTLPGATVGGSPPRLSITATDGTGPAPGSPEREVTFEGDLGRGRTIEERREQASIRRFLFGDADTAACSLCGETYPVRFLWAAHIKKRSLCSDDERRHLSDIAMAACLFGCDALFEHGFITVGRDGAIIGAGGISGPAGLRIKQLHGRRCSAYSAGSAPCFRWHRDNVFRERDATLIR